MLGTRNGPISIAKRNDRGRVPLELSQLTEYGIRGKGGSLTLSLDNSLSPHVLTSAKYYT